MWQVSWLYYGEGGPKVGSVTTPSETTARTIYMALLTLRWTVRLWTPRKELA